MSNGIYLVEGAENSDSEEYAGEAMSQPDARSPERSTALNDFPDELLYICFARLPLRCIPRVRAVCKRWYGLGDAQYLYQLRRNLGLTESWTYKIANEYDQGCYTGLQGRARDPGSGRCRPLALLNGPQRLLFAAAAGGDGLLYILGGRSPLISRTPDAWMVFSRVDVYDPICNSWYQVQPMKTARFSFAAGSFIDRASNEPRLIVAGGYDACGLALSLAEVYDPVRDKWESIPSMRSKSGACRGEVLQGKFYVKQANNGPEAIEVYDPSLSCWTSPPEIAHLCFQHSDDACSGGDIVLDL